MLAPVFDQASDIVHEEYPVSLSKILFFILGCEGIYHKGREIYICRVNSVFFFFFLIITRAGLFKA